MGGEAALAASSCDPHLGASARARRRITARGGLHAEAVAAAQRADRRRTGASACARRPQFLAPAFRKAGATRWGVLFSGVDNEDDPKGIRLDDHDPLAHDEVIVPAPSGINLHHSHRQHNRPDGSRYDRAEVQ
jgi:hypothetical protein